MMLLNIFHTGGLTLGLAILFLGLAAWLTYQSVKAHNSGWVQDSLNEPHREGKEKTPYYKIPQFWGAVGLILVFILIIVFVIAPEYRGVK